MAASNVVAPDFFRAQRLTGEATDAPPVEGPAEQPKKQATFEAFWKEYPGSNKGSKILARVKWDKITGDGLDTRIFDKSTGQYVEVQGLKATPAELCNAAVAYRRKNLKPGSTWELIDGGRYIKHAVTWLNGGHWMDD